MKLPASALRTLALIWLGWFTVLYAFQAVAPLRLNLRRPDTAVEWTATETAANSQDNKPYLTDPFLNRQVSWDSEYYLGIALAGYADPAARTVPHPETGRPIQSNYAFFPLYPLLMRLLLPALWPLGLSPIGTAALAGVIVALAGTLGGLIALYDLARDDLEHDGALRAVFYLLIFPAGFFLAQVYTEGLFIGLAFGALALGRRGQWVWASVLAALAALTRAHGAALALALLVFWLGRLDRGRPLRAQLSWRWAAQGLLALAPLVVFLVWRLSPLGENWAAVQEGYFQRGLLAWNRSLYNWDRALAYAQTTRPALVYYSVELASLGVAVLAGLALLRRQPAVALFSLAVVALSAFSGVAQSMSRYVLVAPATYLALARLGRAPAFDRSWTLLSLLAMGVSAMLFAFDMWVG